MGVPRLRSARARAGSRLEPDAEQTGEALDDRDEVLDGVRPRRSRSPNRARNGAVRGPAGRGPDQGEGLEVEHDPGVGPAVEGEVDPGPPSPWRYSSAFGTRCTSSMKKTSRAGAGEEPDQVAGLLEGRTAGRHEAGPELRGQDPCQAGLAQSRRPGEEDVVGDLSTALRGREGHAEVLDHPGLAHELGEAPWPELDLGHLLRGLAVTALQGRRVEHVVAAHGVPSLVTAGADPPPGGRSAGSSERPSRGQAVATR